MSAQFGRLSRNNVETGGASFATTLGHSRKGKAFRSGHLITLSVPWKRAQNAKNEGFAGRTVSFLQNGYKNTLRKADTLNFLTEGETVNIVLLTYCGGYGMCCSPRITK